MCVKGTVLYAGGVGSCNSGACQRSEGVLDGNITRSVIDSQLQITSAVTGTHLVLQAAMAVGGLQIDLLPRCRSVELPSSL